MEVGRSRHREHTVVDHVVTVPLDHARPDGERLEVFAREIVRADRADASDLPALLYLQGGPGGKSPRPHQGHAWIARAAEKYRVVLLDQRGTGRSAPATRQTLPRRGGPEEQAAYLAHFRADAIVADAELLRRELVGDEPWSILGQSYGGFCALTYLSFAPHGLREVFVTGGLAPLSGGPDDVYRVTYVRTREANERFFARYPEDRERCREIVRMLATRDVRLPTGERLTPRRFQAAGMGLGMKSSFDALHYVLEEAFVEGVDGPALSDTVLTELSSMLGFADRPLYAVMHEPCYGQGLATRWSAERLLADFPEFDVRSMIEGDAPFLFTGEMTYPYQFEEDPALVPLREAAHLLAEKDDWPALYDPDRLARNEVPVYAAVYYDDMYVAREYSLATAAAVRNLVPWITNEYEHDGLRRSGTAVIDRLFAMARTGGQA